MPRNKSATAAKPSPGKLRFDVAALREAAGDKVFARGVEYHEDGQVEIISIDTTRVLATVVGSEIYRTEVKGAGRNISGNCSCPAFSDWGFCKHMVATALAANDLKPDELIKAAGRLDQIRKHLRSKGIETLVEMILALAERDRAFLTELEISAAAENDDDKTLAERLKKAISEATATPYYVGYRDAPAWGQGIESVLDRVERLVEGGRSPVVIELLDHFFSCMEEALGAIDDSDGHGHGACDRACEIHLAACRKAHPDPIALARDLFAREVNSDWDFFAGASDAYSDVLGEAGLAEYRRLAAEAWAKIKPRRAGDQDDHDSGARYQLRSILDGFAERDGDVDARIALRSQHLSSPNTYLDIAKICLDAGRKAQALKWAEEGVWRFEDRPDERLIVFTVALYRRAKRLDDAAKLLWQTFERLPSIELYRQLKATAVGEKAGREARDRAIAYLQKQTAGPDGRARWSSPAALLLQVLMAEGLLTEAWNVVWTRGCGNELLGSLAKASEQSHPADALKAYSQLVEELVRFGGQGNYEAAHKTIGRMRKIRERLGQTKDHTTYLADVMSRHKAKRNFMKLLRGVT